MACNIEKETRVCGECGREKPYYRPSYISTPGYGPHSGERDNYCIYCHKETNTVREVQQSDYSRFRSSNKLIFTPVGIFEQPIELKKKANHNIRMPSGPKYLPKPNLIKTEKEARMDFTQETKQKKLTKKELAIKEKKIAELREQILWEVENYKEEKDENICGFYLDRSDMIWNQIKLAEEAGFDDDDPLLMWLYTEASVEYKKWVAGAEQRKKEAEERDKRIAEYLAEIKAFAAWIEENIEFIRKL